MRRAPIVTAAASFAVGLVAVVALVTSAVAPVAGAGTTSSSSTDGGTTTSSEPGPITTTSSSSTPVTPVSTTTTTTTCPAGPSQCGGGSGKQPQTITWKVPAPEGNGITHTVDYPDAGTLPVRAESTSGLDVTVVVTSGQCSGTGLTSATASTIINLGPRPSKDAPAKCVLTASQAGNNDFTRADDQITSLLITNTKVCPAGTVEPDCTNPPPGEYVPVTPTRILETRTDDGGGSTGCAPNCQTANWKGKAQPADNEVVHVKVNNLTFASPSDLAVAADASAVVVNVTAVTPTNTGFVTVYNCDDARPTASSINLEPGGAAFSAAPNAVIANVSAAGEICIYTKSATHLVADIAGWFPKVSTFQSHSPVRVFETRNNGFDVPINYTGTGAAPANTVLHVPLKDKAGNQVVPAGSKAVAVNVTALDAATDGDLRVWDCKGPAPTSKNLTVAAGRTVPNLILASMDVANTIGEICVQTTVAVDLAVDVQGHFPPAARYTALAGGAQPLLDSSIAAQGILAFEVKNQANIGSDATAVVLTVTGTDTDTTINAGYVTVWPDPTGACSFASRPIASNLNLSTGRTATNLVIAKLAAESTKLCIFSQAGANLTVSAFGFFTGVVKAA
jgi:hypothetical protein